MARRTATPEQPEPAPAVEAEAYQPADPDVRDVGMESTVRLAVAWPHNGLVVGDLTITNQGTDVPTAQVMHVNDAAKAAGVRLVEKEQ